MNVIKENERVNSLDMLRGVALLGIFFVNVSSFFHPILYLNPDEYYDASFDHFLYTLIDIFAQGSFYPLFAFLFGYSAILFADRTRRNGMNFPLLFSRRLIVLLLFGCIHAFVIWHGDILITYAIAGFIFICFYACKGKTLLITSLIVYVLPFSFLIFGSLFVNQDEYEEVRYSETMVQQSLETYRDGGFQEIMVQRFDDWYLTNGPVTIGILLIAILPLMLMGAGFAKQKWLEEVGQHKELLKVLMLLGLIGGLFFKTLPYIQGASYANTLLQAQFGGPLLTIFYITGIVLLVENKKMHRIFYLFTHVGRLSFSNYLVQSFICTTLAYSYGFGLYGKVSYTGGVILGVVIYLLQLFMSKWWLTTFQIGPLEYMWRWGTYGKKPALKKEIGL